MKVSSPRRHRPRLEIIPFIDVMFFLLATFMIMSLAMVKNPGVAVQLPKAQTSASEERKEKEVTLTITDKGDVFFDHDKVSTAELPGKLAALKAEAGPDKAKVFLNSDRKATFDNVVGVLDEIRKQGISKIAIQTERAEKAR
ncbi:ExbD/TolR family protein [Methylacidimicrobium tartarophylax]|uniref:Biopolymer transport protein ExbD n=1 Tax=Methylacidimicrobium tartarophylax TaxID=1041768 RepID=A0A5E6M7U2_9BACT|nr:biopolymer transporter ExbD [Methylacidimicrobium tartarophylax]VVM05275.1 Biopolymer transport protein ExbD [Methylacidimicrobium tartarophylax]